jgi:hypothetical protein
MSTVVDRPLEVDPAAQSHVEQFVRTALGIPHGSHAEVPAMPAHLRRQLLRAEELETSARDQWGCWEFAQCESYRRGTLWKPEIDEWLADVRGLLSGGGDAPLWPGGRPFVVCPSHDVDMVTRTWTPKQIGRSLHIALTGSRDGPSRAEAVLRALARPLRFRVSSAPSSAATLQRCMEIELARDVRASYFFTVYPPGRASSYDCVYTLDDDLLFRGERRRVRDVVSELVGTGFDVGLHGSYFAAVDGELLSTQRTMLESAVGAEVRTLRQHWLQWDARLTPAAQELAGFTADSTLGFNRNIGFRAGTSFPFFLSATDPFRSLNVLEVPLVVQEAALFAVNSLELDERLAREVVELVLDRVAAVGGVFTFLVHPHSLLDDRVASLYAWLLDQALDRGAWVASTAEIDSWWRQRASGLETAATAASGGVPT